ncbi:hypothetical protein K1719_012492 [Acacia pycnantha]|nr:hypothetical protein K1719_012492 [Acacia pycnantha]
MKSTARAIRCTLLEAEAKARDHQVSFWLDRLKDVLSDADDLLDDLSTEALTRELMTRNKVAKKVRIFFSKPNQFVYDLKMGRKMREIRGKLEEIDDEKKKLKLNDQPLKPSSDCEDRKQTQIAQKILGKENTKDMEQVQQDLRQAIQGKKFLIVLDDVWNEDVGLWLKLKSLLMEGAHGSKLIVTTPSVKVAEVMSTDGQTITLQGVPLAIRIVGRLVHDKTSEGTDLSYLRNSELWNMDEVEDRIFGMVNLSYDHLSSPMKNCVAFCSLFPKDFSFNKQTLIQMWMAEGFIQSLDPMRCEEDVGHECFMNLLSRSFFQDVTRNKDGEIVWCKMHDLVHDLARFVAKNEYLVVIEGKEQRTRGTRRHLSYDVSRKNWKVPTSSLKYEKLRTVLLLERLF